MRPASSAGGLPGRLAGPGLLVLLLAWTAMIHHGLGPRPELGAHWYSPNGFLTRWLAATPFGSLLTERWQGFLVFWTPAALLAAGCWLASRSALLRTAALAGALASALFLFYALGAETSRIVWTLFHWRASGAMLGLAVSVAAALTTPWLAASWLGLPWILRIVSYLPVAFAVVAIERGVTGTNPRLPFAISPWPAVPVFGLDVAGTVIASLLAGAALGLFGLARLRRGHPGTGIAALLVGLLLPALWLARAGQGFLPFRVGDRAIGLTLPVAALVIAAAALPRFEPERLARRARVLGVAALLLGLPLLAGQGWARLDYARNRDLRAERVIDALAHYYEREQIYPETLEALVTSGDLEEVPEPTAGFALLGDEARFTYQAFGTSYLLEFPAPRWVQCAYNPPYQAEPWEDEPDDALSTCASSGERFIQAPNE